ncbi:hypothetical protein A2U01_0039441, partial [Trifolium medium]|nr:hypothetical protein [Trifolium medium]
MVFYLDEEELPAKVLDNCGVCAGGTMLAPPPAATFREMCVGALSVTGSKVYQKLFSLRTSVRLGRGGICAKFSKSCPSPIALAMV